MGLRVAGDGDVFLLAGEVAAGQRDDVAMVNRFLAHLKGRNFALTTRRAYAFDMLNFLRFLTGQGVGLGKVRPTDLFDYLDWQTQPKRTASSTVVQLSERRGAAPATQNRRIAAVRALFEFAVITGVVTTSPRCRRRAAPAGFGRVGACWGISRLVTEVRAAGWCGSSGYCRKALSWPRLRHS
jgi:integrase/recombinase XerC